MFNNYIKQCTCGVMISKHYTRNIVYIIYYPLKGILLIKKRDHWTLPYTYVKVEEQINEALYRGGLEELGTNVKPLNGVLILTGPSISLIDYEYALKARVLRRFGKIGDYKYRWVEIFPDTILEPPLKNEKNYIYVPVKIEEKAFKKKVKFFDLKVVMSKSLNKLIKIEPMTLIFLKLLFSNAVSPGKFQTV